MPMLHPDLLPVFDHQVRLRNQVSANPNDINLAAPDGSGVGATLAQRTLLNVTWFYYGFRLFNAAGTLLVNIVHQNGQLFRINGLIPHIDQLRALQAGVLSEQSFQSVRAFLLTPIVVGTPVINQSTNAPATPVLNFTPWVELLQPEDLFSIAFPGRLERVTYKVEQPGTTRRPGFGLWGLDAFHIPVSVVDPKANPSSTIIAVHDGLILRLSPSLPAANVDRQVWVGHIQERSSQGQFQGDVSRQGRSFEPGVSSTGLISVRSPVEVATSSQQREYFMRYTPDVRVGSIITDGPDNWTVLAVEELGRRQFQRVTCGHTHILTGAP